MIIGVDVDDVLLRLNGRVIEHLNELFNTDYKYEDIDWSFSNIDNQEHLDYVDSLYRDPMFMSELELFDGAVDFVSTLNEIGEVVFVTAVYKESMSTRKDMLKELFPFICEHNTILTGRKDLIHLDVLIDDSFKNVDTCRADLKILMNRPWNKEFNSHHIKRAHTYEEVINLVKKKSLQL